MKIVPFIPDQGIAPPQQSGGDSGAFAKALDGVGAVLARADHAEDAFAVHAGSLQDAVFERAQADVMLSVATAAAQRTAQAVQSILSMQI